MTTPKCSLYSNPILRKFRLLQFRLALYQLQASAPLEERRAEVEAPYPQGSCAAEDYIDGYVDYQSAALRLEVPQCRGDRSSYYGQGWQACAQEW